MALAKPALNLSPQENTGRIGTAFDAIDANTAAAGELRSAVDKKADTAVTTSISERVNGKLDTTAFNQQVAALVQQIAVLTAGLDTKASSAVVAQLSTILAGKADSQTVIDLTDALAAGLNTKADRTNFNAVADQLRTKADSATVAALVSTVQGKADTTTVAQLSTILAGKADTQPLLDAIKALASKADIATVTTLQTVVARLSPNTGLPLYGVRPGEYTRAWSHTLDGRPSKMPEIDPALAVADSDGYVVRLQSAQTLAAMAAEKVVPGRRYVYRWIVRRRQDTDDPANDAVRVFLRCLDRFWQSASPTSAAVQDVTNLRVADGAKVVTCVACTAQGDGITHVIPASTVYIRVALQVFGANGVTDVEEMGLVPEGAGVLNVDTAAFDGRLTQVQNAVTAADAGPRLDTLEAKVGGAKISDYLTLDAVRAARISDTVDVLRVLRWSIGSLACLATYVRVGQAPTDHVAWVQSLDGAVWELTVAAVDPRMLGVIAEDSLANHMRMQAALDYAGMRCRKVVPPTLIVPVWKPLLLDSGVTVDGVGQGSHFPVSTGYSVPSGTIPAIFTNRNNKASQLTDHDITIRNIVTDYGSYPVRTGAHAIYLRMVDRPLVEYCYSSRGDNHTALLGCRDGKVLYNNCENVENCGYDAWAGSGDYTCIGNTVRDSNAQGVQYSGAETDYSARASYNAVLAFNRCYRVRTPEGYGTAVIANAVAKGSSVSRVLSLCNYAEDSDNGVVFSGAGGDHVSMLDVLNKVDKGPILVQAEQYADGTSAAPSRVRIIRPHLIDCDHAPGNIALIALTGGVEHEVDAPKVTVTTPAVPYDSLVWLNAPTARSRVGDVHGPKGAGARVIDQGTKNIVHYLDMDTATEVFQALTRHERGVLLGPAGGNAADVALGVSRKGQWTPTLLIGGSGDGVTYAAQQGQWVRIGNLVLVSGAIGLTGKGTRAGSVSISGLPDYVSGDVPVGGSITNFFNVDVSGAMPVLLSGNVMQVKVPAPGSTLIDLTNAQLRDQTYLFFTITYLTVDP